MIDWFVVLTPLVLLPLFLALVFVGCGLNTAGAPVSPVRLNFGPGFEHLESLSVTFTFTPTGAQAPSLAAIETLKHADISPSGGSIDKTDEFEMHKQPAGDLICKCVMRKNEDPLDNVTTALGEPHVPGDQMWIFELTTDGNSFDITLVSGEVELVGGI